MFLLTASHQAASPRIPAHVEHRHLVRPAGSSVVAKYMQDWSLADQRYDAAVCKLRLTRDPPGGISELDDLRCAAPLLDVQTVFLTAFGRQEKPATAGNSYTRAYSSPRWMKLKRLLKRTPGWQSRLAKNKAASPAQLGGKLNVASEVVARVTAGAHSFLFFLAWFKVCLALLFKTFGICW